MPFELWLYTDLSCNENTQTPGLHVHVHVAFRPSKLESTGPTNKQKLRPRKNNDFQKFKWPWAGL